jgi:hypothetical protein
MIAAAAFYFGGQRFFFVAPWPPPERDPERRAPELLRAPFLRPVPDGPGRFALFFAPLDRRFALRPVLRGASFFCPRPRPAFFRAFCA